MDKLGMEYAIQMYSVRDVSKLDLREALKIVAQTGYRYVEFAGFFDHTAAEVKGWLDEFGLKCCSTHTKFDLIKTENIDDTIEYHKTIGCDTIIVPGGVPISSPDELDKSCLTLNNAAKKLSENGMRLGYHNHSPEFLPSPFGKLVIEELIARTVIDFEIDTFWAFNADVDPVSFMDAHKDRIHIIHLKDGIPVDPDNRNWGSWNKGAKGKALGEGKAPIREIRKWAIQNGVRMVVESEGLDPTGPEEISRSLSYLRTL